jgi:hypothetical protein
MQRPSAGAEIPPPVADGSLVEGLRKALVVGEFAPAAEGVLVSTEGDDLQAAKDIELRLHRLKPASAALVRLFLLEQDVSERSAADALGALGAEAAARLGVLRRVGDRWRATIRLALEGDLWIASDLRSAPLRATHVAGVHRPSETLAKLVVRRPVDSALDIGTGNGIQALLLARHADSVVATDVNERALRFTEFNALLNGVHNIETRAGSFLEPVRDQRFDVVACNPPYVISPERRLQYRDAEIRGDVLSERLVAGLPGALNDGGFASILVSSVPSSDDVLLEPMLWAAATGCSAWVFHLHSETPREAAEWWAGPDGPDALRVWLRWYEAQSITRIAYGAVVLRRQDGSEPWVDGMPLTGGPLGPASDHLERLFAARARLNGSSPARVEWPPDVDLSSTESGATLRMRAGLGLEAELSHEVAPILQELRSGNTVAAALRAAAVDVDIGRQIVHRLAETGFLIPKPETLTASCSSRRRP